MEIEREGDAEIAAIEVDVRVEVQDPLVLACEKPRQQQPDEHERGDAPLPEMGVAKGLSPLARSTRIPSAPGTGASPVVTTQTSKPREGCASRIEAPRQAAKGA